MTAQTALPGVTAMIVAVAIFAAAGQSIAAGELGVRSTVAGSKTEPFRPVSYLSQLGVNISNAERYVVSGVCEREGIHQISRILKHSDFEEMWAFLPRANGSGECQWHEIGRSEKSGKNSAHLRVDLEYLGQLMAANAAIYIYHFHPLKYFDCAAHPDCSRAMVPGRRETFDRRWISDLVFSMPSPSDIHFMMEQTSRFYRRFQRVGTIKHKVVTPYGVVNYGLTDAGLVKFEVERYGRSEGLYITWVATSRLADDRVEGIIEESEGSIMAAVRRLAHTLNSPYLWVTHGTFAAEGERVSDE